jgi:hypothetical protein
VYDVGITREGGAADAMRARRPHRRDMNLQESERRRFTTYRFKPGHEGVGGAQEA